MILFDTMLLMSLLKPNKNKDEKGGKAPKINRRQLLSNFLTAIIIFLVLMSLYTVLMEGKKDVEELPLSDVAKKMLAGDVKKITVEGEKLSVILKDNSTIESKKESEASLSETFKNYGVLPELK